MEKASHPVQLSVGQEKVWSFVRKIEQWTTVYAFVLLPLTTPVARLLIQAFLELLKI